MPDPTMMPVHLAVLTVARFFGEWQLSVLSAVVCGVLLVGYLAAYARARRIGTAWSLWRVLCWLAGVAVLAFATQGSPAVYADSLFWMHMIQHVTLIMLVPIGLLAGYPLDLTLAIAGRRRPQIARLFTGRVVSVLTHPLVGLALYTVAIVGTHLTGFMNAMMLHPWLHGLEAAVYVVVGLLFFAPIVTDAPIRWRLSPLVRMVMLVLAMPVDTFTGVILGQSDHYPWPAMAAMHPSWSMSPLADLHAGGAVMWIGGDAVMAVLFGAAAITWARAAATGDTSALGGWLSEARLNYQQTVTANGLRLTLDETGRVEDATTVPGVRTGDSDADLAAYNAYLARINGRP